MSIVNIGIIGFGNMGKCIAKGLIQYGKCKCKTIYTYRREQEKLIKDSKELHVTPMSNLKDLVLQSDVIVLSVSSSSVEEVMKEIEPFIENKILVSVVASKRIEDYQKMMIHPQNLHLIVAIPNIPIQVGEGILVTSKNHTLTKEEYIIFERLFSPIAMIYLVEDSLLSVAETITGCSPAFVYMMIQAISDSATQFGIPRDENYSLIAQMVLGSARLLLNSKKHPVNLKEEVASPKGTTIKGIISLEKSGFMGIINEAYEKILK